MASQESINLAQQMYVVYYGRPADPGGLTYWADFFDATDNLEQALNAFGTSDEFTQNFGSLDSTQLINNLYQQMYGRDSDPDGLQFYSDRLERGEATLASIGKQIADGSLAADLTTLNNRIKVANSFTTEVETKNKAYTENDIDYLKQKLKEVYDDDAIVTQIESTLLSYVEGLDLDDTADTSNTSSSNEQQTSLNSDGYLLKIYEGSSGIDSLSFTESAYESTDPTPLLLGYSGNDTLTAQSDGYVILSGGKGDDSYIVSNTGKYLVYDVSGTDTLTLPLAFDDTLFTYIDVGDNADGSGEHLLITDKNDSNGLNVQINFWNEESIIETLIFNDQNYSFDQLKVDLTNTTLNNITLEQIDTAFSVTSGTTSNLYDVLEVLGASENIGSTYNIDLTGTLYSNSMFSYLAENFNAFA